MLNNLKCHLDINISCNLSNFCSINNKIIDKKDFIYFWKILWNLNYSNKKLMIYLLLNNKIPYIIDIDRKITEIFLLKKDYLLISNIKLYFRIIKWWKSRYALLVSKININNSYSELLSWLYPKCCTENYFKLNWKNWEKDLWFIEVFNYVYSNSKFICPLFSPNFFISEWDKTFSCFPYYQMCSFNCSSTKNYIDNLLSYLNINLLINKWLFNYLKLPFLFLWWKKIFINWYVENWVLIYEGLYIFHNNWLTYLKKNYLNINLIRKIYFPWYLFNNLFVTDLKYIW